MSKINKNNLFQTLVYSKEYFEYLALEILKQFDSNKYCELYFIGGNDLPDLQSIDKQTIGVEVTRAISKDMMECDSLNAMYGGCHMNDIPEKVKKIVRNCGRDWYIDSEGYTHAFYSYWDDKQKAKYQYKMLIEAFKRKVDRLNQSHAKHFEMQELFVILNDTLSTDSIKQAYTEFLTIQLQKKVKYQTLYILTSGSHGNYLYLCTGKNSVCLNDISGFIGKCREVAYINSGMREESLKLLMSQGHIKSID